MYPHSLKTLWWCPNGRAILRTVAWLPLFHSSNVGLQLSMMHKAEFLCYQAIAIYKPADVRPILTAYHGKDIPLEYAKKEAEGKQKHIEEWEKKKGEPNPFGAMFGLSVRLCFSCEHIFDRVHTESWWHYPSNLPRGETKGSPAKLPRRTSVYCQEQGPFGEAVGAGATGDGGSGAKQPMGSYWHNVRCTPAPSRQ